VTTCLHALIAVVVAAMAGNANAQTDAAAPTKTNICELLKSPERFNGRLVEVRARFVGAFEWSGLVDANCRAQLLADSDGFPGLSGKSGEYAFIRSFSELDYPNGLDWRPIILPHSVRLVKNDAYQQFDDAARKNPTRGSPLFDITITVVGRFDHLSQQMVAIRENRREKPRPYMAGFGHLNASLNRLVWQSVSDVAVVPSPAPADEKKNVR
jgi:hypothetical protein